MSEVSAGLGIFGAVVWPTYMGAATADPGEGPVPEYEPFEDPHYKRGQITWVTQDDGEVLGSAHVYAPEGIYTHLIFCHGPIRDMMIGQQQPLWGPFILSGPGVIYISPIRNKDYQPPTAL